MGFSDLRAVCKDPAPMGWEGNTVYGVTRFCIACELAMEDFARMFCLLWSVVSRMYRQVATSVLVIASTTLLRILPTIQSAGWSVRSQAGAIDMSGTCSIRAASVSPGWERTSGSGGWSVQCSAGG